MKQHTFQNLHPTHRSELKRYCDEFTVAEVARQIGMSPSGLARVLTAPDRGVYPSTIRNIAGFLDGKAKSTNGHGTAQTPPPPNASVAKPKTQDDPSVVDAFGAICKALEPFPVSKRASILSAAQVLMGR